MTDDIQELRDRCVAHLHDRKAEDLVSIDLRGFADFSDYFIICNGNSDTHARALADSVIEGMKEEGQRPWQIEGYDTRKWILIDFIDVVVHIFQPDTRVFYGLERLWGDAPIEHIEDDGPDVDSTQPQLQNQ